MNVVVIGMDTQHGLRSVTGRRSAHELGPYASEKGLPSSSPLGV